uniref:Uncharacterized protein n=1 Tax=Solanum tuberosum TaxID=4113 RepID=M1BDR9_SOLTU
MVLLNDGHPPPVGGIHFSITDFPALNESASIDPKNPKLSVEKSFANSLNQTEQQSNKALRKEVSVVGGISQIKWTEEEIERMNQIEDLQFAVIGKFTYEWSDLEELRRIIPQQCEIRGGFHTIQKGKAKVLSSGKVVGDPGHWNVVRDNRKNRSNKEKLDNQMTVTTENSFDALTQEKITQADVNIDNSSNTKQDKGVENEQPMSAKEWVIRSFGKVLQGEASTSTIPVQHDNMDQNQQHNTHENEHGNENHESVNMEDKQQTCRDSWAVVVYNKHNNQFPQIYNEKRREDRGNIDNKLAIVVDPTDCQIKEAQILAIREFPNKVLYDIITHNVEENALLEIEGLGVTTKVSKEDDDDVLAHIDKEADLSPRILKAARKEKKQGNGDSAQPIRIQPKRYKAYNR